MLLRPLAHEWNSIFKCKQHATQDPKVKHKEAPFRAQQTRSVIFCHKWCINVALRHIDDKNTFLKRPCMLNISGNCTFPLLAMGSIVA